GLFRIALAVALLLPAVALILGLQLRPSVPYPAAISAQETRVLEQLIVDNTPARFRSTDERSVTMSEGELNLLGRFLSRNFPQLEGWRGDLRLRERAARVRLSRPWPSQDSPLYMNVQIRVAEA